MGSEVKGDEHAEGPIRICKACLGCRSKSLGQRAEGSNQVMLLRVRFRAFGRVRGSASIYETPQAPETYSTRL